MAAEVGDVIVVDYAELNDVATSAELRAKIEKVSCQADVKNEWADTLGGAVEPDLGMSPPSQDSIVHT